MARLISYLRVSTRQQGESGLGIEAQRDAVENHARQLGATIEAEYVEIESGKRKDRPELLKALAHCKRSTATLIVAKLDRLARNVAFTSTLMESKVEFLAVDNPHANKFTIHILAAVAEHEAEQIGHRTKAALQAAKRRGVKLGSARPGHWTGKEDRRRAGAIAGGKAAAESHRQAADESYSDLVSTIRGLREAGKTLQAIADELSGQGHTTRRGRPWNPMQVSRVLNRSMSN
jgi:DNA invertase Pin-like site-specific DNA recombinase